MLEGRKMKSATLTTVLFIGLALMGNGCAVVGPPTQRQEVSQQQISENNGASHEYDGFWGMLYNALYLGGQSVANK
jgi:hypothetical protein